MKHCGSVIHASFFDRMRQRLAVVHVQYSQDLGSFRSGLHEQKPAGRVVAVERRLVLQVSEIETLDTTLCSW